MAKMKVRIIWLVVFLVVGAVVGLLFYKTDDSFVYDNAIQSDPAAELMRLRNEGLAFYELHDFQRSRIRFQAAYELNNNSAVEAYNLAVSHFHLNHLDKAASHTKKSIGFDHTFTNAYYLSGLIHKRLGNIHEAIEAFAQASVLAPAAADPYFQLALLYRETGKKHEARQALVYALQFNPYHQAAHYQIAQIDRFGEDRTPPVSDFTEFGRLRRAAEHSINPEDYETGLLAKPVVNSTNALARIEEKSHFKPAFTQLHFDDDKFLAFDLHDINDDMQVEFIAATDKGWIQFFTIRGDTRDIKKQWPVHDFNNINNIIVERFDAKQPARVLIASRDGIALSDADVTAGLSGWQWLSRDSSAQVSVLDFDHDGDLDIVTMDAKQLFLNKGNAEFARLTEHDILQALTDEGRFLADDFSGRSSLDIVTYAQAGNRVVIEDQKGGQYKPFSADMPDTNSIVWLQSEDMDNSGSMDLVGIDKGSWFIDFNEGGFRFRREPLLSQSNHDEFVRSYQTGTLGDFDNDGSQDVLLFSQHKAVLFRNLGRDEFRPLSLTDFSVEDVSSGLLSYDYDHDGKVDVLAISADGQLVIWKNDSEGVGNWFKLALYGLRSPPSGLGTQIEVRKGFRYAKYRSKGLPVHVGLGEDHYAEVVRIRWPNGFVENKFKVDRLGSWRFEESERISGSCPSIFAWNGELFGFVTDAFISGPMGVPFNRTQYFPVDHDEYIKLGVHQLKEEGGQYHIRITEELREAVFLDKLQLLAVDHPKNVDFYPNERLAPPPFPEFYLHVTEHAAPPVRAVDHLGHDVGKQIAHIDGDHAGSMTPSQYTGMAEPNGIIFDIPDDAVNAKRLRLFLTGWFYYFDSTSMISISQREDLDILWPQIQALTAQGEWKRLAYTGVPLGKGKTLIVDLSGKLPADTRQLRIWSNMELYWDQILIDTSEPPEQHYSLTDLSLQTAQLRLHGFSTLLKPLLRSSPERFDYNIVTFQSFWSPLEGRYTRYGNVQTLLEKVDSQFVVMGAGDELLLTFNATGPVKPGWQRDFLLYLDGYVKDGDKYTAHAGRLEPLPYSGMREYPYAFSETAHAIFHSNEYLQYREKYQTRLPLTFTGPDFVVR